MLAELTVKQTPQKESGYFFRLRKFIHFTELTNLIKTIQKEELIDSNTECSKMQQSRELGSSKSSILNGSCKLRVRPTVENQKYAVQYAKFFGS